MRTIINTSNWRMVTAIVLVLTSALFLSEALAKPRARSKKALSRQAPALPAAATPASGILDPSNRSVTYTDGPLAPNPTGVLGAPNCTGPNTCSDFAVTVNASSLAATHNVTWVVEWTPQNVDLDIFLEDQNHNLVANNNSTADPSAITVPIPADGTIYHLVVSASVGTAPINGSVTLTQKYPAAQQGLGAAPRYMNYPAAPSQANGTNEPSIGVDWNPNVPTLRDVSGQTRKNTGGVAFFTVGSSEYRANFDDCSSPAVNLWENVSATFTRTFVLSDPIGFVDHFSADPLGLNSNPPTTPGRVFSIDLIGGQGNSLGSYSDDDGNSYLPGGNGGSPAGPDHETLGGGPFHAPLPAAGPVYQNAIYYCSQNTATEAECSRSDDGGQTFGPGIPIFNPTICGGGIHGHVKVSPQGTVYVPNSSCAVGTPPGANGAAVSKDNGLTWTQMTVPGSTGSQDPAVGIGQNSVGKSPSQVPNTVYLGWVSGDGHAHIAHSPDEGTTWQDDTDVSSIFGIANAVFPVVVAGDDNRAAYGFLGTDPDFPNRQVWHLYIATTYDSGHSWILIDATPDDPVQIGNVCLLGLGCSGGRNLLDFNGIDIDKEGRVLLGYTDGCIGCTNAQTTQSNGAHGTIARQSGGRRLFAAFDPIEPAPPAAPQIVSANRQSSPAGVLVTWLKPDNGGSPVTGYNVYRGPSSGTEAFVAHVNGADTTKYLDQTADPMANSFYKIMAVNAIGESTYCHELNVNGAQPGQSACQPPYLMVDGAGAAGTVPSDPTQGEMTIQKVSMGEPFISCADQSITFVMKVNTLSPAPPPNAEWQVLFTVPASVASDHQAHSIFVEGQTQNTPTMQFDYGYRTSSPTGGSQDTAQCGTALPIIGGTCPVSGSFNADGTITIKLDVSQPIPFVALGGTSVLFSVNIPSATALTAIQGNTYLLVGASPGGSGGGLIETVSTTAATGTYTTIGNIACSAGAPVAGLTATPQSGAPPLAVSFDGSSSTDTSPCAVIASYTLDFGDGSPAVTQSSPLFNHTYTQAGNYPARLTVTDSAGQVSASFAQVVISVAPTVPQLTGVVSRKTHGAAGPFDIVLQVGGNRPTECRSGGANGDYTLIFVFQNPLTSVGGVSLTGTGMVSSSAIGGDPHQYVVNLTGVTNAQVLNVTLSNVHDTASNAGDITQPFAVLVGDTTNNGAVNSSDVAQTQSQSGQSVANGNFREDVTANGAINSSDVATVQSQSGTALP